MCSPLTDSRCASPDRRIASASVLGDRALVAGRQRRRDPARAARRRCVWICGDSRCAQIPPRCRARRRRPRPARSRVPSRRSRRTMRRARNRRRRAPPAAAAASAAPAAASPRRATSAGGTSASRQIDAHATPAARAPIAVGRRRTAIGASRQPHQLRAPAAARPARPAPSNVAIVGRASTGARHRSARHQISASPSAAASTADAPRPAPRARRARAPAAASATGQPAAIATLHARRVGQHEPGGDARRPASPAATAPAGRAPPPASVRAPRPHGGTASRTPI